MSLGDCPNWPECGHKTHGACDADMSGKRAARASAPAAASWDEKALEVARRFTQDTETQRRASLQCAVLDAMQWAVAAPLPDAGVREAEWLEKAMELAMVMVNVGPSKFSAACVALRAHLLSRPAASPDVLRQVVDALESTVPHREPTESQGNFEMRCQEHEAAIASLQAAIAAPASQDAARFNWYFGATPKGEWLMTYLDGLKTGWTTDQWRAAIDAAIAAQTKEHP